MASTALVAHQKKMGDASSAGLNRMDSISTANSNSNSMGGASNKVSATSKFKAAVHDLGAMAHMGTLMHKSHAGGDDMYNARFAGIDMSQANLPHDPNYDHDAPESQAFKSALMDAHEGRDDEKAELERSYAEKVSNPHGSAGSYGRAMDNMPKKVTEEEKQRKREVI